MENVLVQRGSLEDTADAIRSKLSSQALIAPEEFATNILNIPTGGGGRDYGTITVAPYTVSFDTTGSFTNCTVVINDAKEFYDWCVVNGFMSDEIEYSQYGPEVSFSYSNSTGLWANYNDYGNTFTTAELNTHGVTVTITNPDNYASFGYNQITTSASDDQSLWTTHQITDGLDFSSLGFLSQTYASGGMSRGIVNMYYYLDGVKIPKAGIVGYAIGQDVTELPSMFLSFTNVKSLDIDGATKIGDYFLTETPYDSALVIPSSVTKIGNYFLNKSNINSNITIPSSVTSIGQYFLNGCKLFNSTLTISANTTVGDYFMYNCEAYNQAFPLTDTTVMPSYCMNNCKAFNQPVTLNNATKLNTYFLTGCVAFNSAVSMPEVLEIGYGFMSGDSSFNKSISFPKLQLVVGSAFMNNCTAFAQPLSFPSTAVIQFQSYSGNFMYNCNNFTGPLTFNNSSSSGVVFPTSASYLNQILSTTTSTAVMYTTGVTIKGAGRSYWINNLANRTTSPFRKLINGGA